MIAMLSPIRTAARTKRMATSSRKKAGARRVTPEAELPQARRSKTAPKIKNPLAPTLSPFAAADYLLERCKGAPARGCSILLAPLTVQQMTGSLAGSRSKLAGTTPTGSPSVSTGTRPSAVTSTRRAVR